MRSAIARIVHRLSDAIMWRSNDYCNCSAAIRNCMVPRDMSRNHLNLAILVWTSSERANERRQFNWKVLFKNVSEVEMGKKVSAWPNHIKTESQTFKSTADWSPRWTSSFPSELMIRFGVSGDDYKARMCVRCKSSIIFIISITMHRVDCVGIRCTFWSVYFDQRFS